MPGIKTHGSDNGWSLPFPERNETLFLHYSEEGVEHVFVVPPLSLRKSLVCLEPDQGQVLRVPDDGAQKSGSHLNGHFFVKGNVASVVFFSLIEQGSVDTQTGGGVGGLSHQG